MIKKITNDQLRELAGRYGFLLAEVKAVFEVEAAGSGFLSDGRPKILFERHYFSKLTGGIFDLTHPDISSQIRGGYKGGSAEWTRFDKAQKLNREAAIKSCSWGAGQVMGIHYKDLGFSKPQDFLNANFKDEASQFELMLKFIVRNPAMFQAIKGKNWAKFAQLYNGPKFRENKYHTKLAAAFEKHNKSLTA